MFLLDAPYVSDFLKESVRSLGLPVLDTLGARALAGDAGLEFIDTIEFSARMAVGQRIYANSENALAHMHECGCNDDLTRQIDLCKDKALFRETIKDVHPDYRFMRATFDEMADLDISSMQCPFVVKPARGFFSLGVHVVNDHSEWSDVVGRIGAERDAMNAEYPKEVVDGGVFIIEEGIEGDEYALDIYFDGNGEPVITNILLHHFISDDDVSDRFYYTSTAIIEQWLGPFTEYVTTIGQACRFRNFPIHLEVRVDEAGQILPIEANPLRFAGWCVADITQHAWGFNPYEYYFQDKRPDWPAILKGRENTACGMVIGDVPPGVDRARIESVDYDGFCAMFDTVLELRKIDYRAYPVFAFAFIRMTLDGVEELKPQLAADFKRFIRTSDD